MEMTPEIVVACLRRTAQVLHEQRQYLTDLDSPIGDADHGINMDRGFTAVAGKLDAVEGQDPAALLKLVASTLISTVGGASGPLYGTAFLRAGTAVTGKAALTTDALRRRTERRGAGRQGSRQSHNRGKDYARRSSPGPGSTRQSRERRLRFG